MPEGPELHLTSLFINRVCSGRLFGRIQKSEISKNPVVKAPAQIFSIHATSRGKEIKLVLTDPNENDATNSKYCRKTGFNPLNIMFTFGLAGKFEFYEASELMKHAHLNFFTVDQKPQMVLSFVDYMRFGKWTPNADFSFKDRGPCVLQEYSLFRNHVLQNLSSSAFNKPICEALLNQRYFNGIGNYLRAEILHRLKIPPFVCARNVLEPLAEESCVKSEHPDILQLCNILPKEVVELEGSWYDGKDRGDTTNNFNNWLQCYYKDGMKNISDHNKRTVWYSGPLGPMVPKDGVTRGKKKGKSRANKGDTSTTEEEGRNEANTKPKARKRTNKVKDEGISSGKKVKLEQCLGESTVLEQTKDLTKSPSPVKRVTRNRVKKYSQAKDAARKARELINGVNVKTELLNGSDHGGTEKTKSKKTRSRKK